MHKCKVCKTQNRDHNYYKEPKDTVEGWTHAETANCSGILIQIFTSKLHHFIDHPLSFVHDHNLNNIKVPTNSCIF